MWRLVGERFIDGCVQEHDRYGGGSVITDGVGRLPSAWEDPPALRPG